MTWFRNLKMRAKLLLSFMIIVALVAGLSIYAVATLSSIDTSYSNLIDGPMQGEVLLLDFRSSLREVRRLGTSMLAYTPVQDGDDKINSDYNAAVSGLDETIGYLEDYETIVQSNPLFEETRADRLSASAQLADLLSDYRTQCIDAVHEASLTGDFDAALAAVQRGVEMNNTIRDTTDTLVNAAITTTDTLNRSNTDATNMALVILIIIAAIVVLLSIIIALFVAGVIQKPVTKLVEVAENVAKGNLNVNIDTSGKDELGMLSNSFHSVVSTINTMMTDIGTMHQRHEDGQMRHNINKDAYQGQYKEVVGGINDTVNSYVAMLDDVFGALTGYGKGDFSYKLVQYKGEKAVANREMDLFRDTIAKIIREIDTVAKAGADGKLDTRADANAYLGEWKNIMVGLNNVLESVIKPIDEIQLVLGEMSRGNFETSVRGVYAGDFNEMKTAMNNTITSIAGYIKEISEILSKMAAGDLRVSITRDYIGQFNIMKESINSIVKTLNKTMTEILSASEQVLSGAKQISSTSMSLAEGASEQASAIQELTASIETINNQTQKNAQNAAEANTLSDRSTANATSGNEEMTRMLGAMNQIKDSSNDISRVIKTISDIAFQTNLLALNASVEAARAGEHGRGFAVVAGEVRNLATKSQSSANDTATLIADSNSRVNEGTKIAETTAQSLHVIVENAAQVSSIISTIAEASKEQADAVAQVSIGLNQISQVVQNNSSTSEESAAAAQQLNSQAELLQQMVSYFKI